ncbi:MAG: hypothetical protein ACJARP_002082 [Vicingaceae bacterium]|jgi:hypothetical protein
MDGSPRWLIARDSSNLIDLFNTYQYDGHPMLWVLCLWLLRKIASKKNLSSFSSVSINLHSIGSCWLEYSLIRSKKKAAITSPSVFMPFNGLTSWPKNWRLFVVFVGDFSLVREKMWRIVTLFSTLISLLNCYSCVDLSSCKLQQPKYF